MPKQKPSGTRKSKKLRKNMLASLSKVTLISIPLWYSVFNAQAENVALHEDSAFLAVVIVIGGMTVLSEHEFAKLSNQTTKHKVIMILSFVFGIYISALSAAILLGHDGKNLLDFLIFRSGNFLYTIGFWVYVSLGFARIMFRDVTLPLKQLEEYSDKAVYVVFYAMFIAVFVNITFESFDIYANTLAVYFISYLYISEFWLVRIKS